MTSKFEIVDRFGNPVDDDVDILPDGGKLRVPMMLRDADTLTPMRLAQDAVARRFGLRHALDLHQPGPRFCTDAAANDAKRQAYLDSVRDLTEAWRNPPPSASDAWKTNNMSDREVARVHNTGDPVRDAYLDQVADLTSAWQRRR
jgi:hypothetical protein